MCCTVCESLIQNQVLCIIGEQIFERCRDMIKGVYLDSAWIYIDESVMMGYGGFLDTDVETMSVCFKTETRWTVPLHLHAQS